MTRTKCTRHINQVKTRLTKMTRTKCTRHINQVKHTSNLND